MRRLDGNADGLLDREEMLAVARERFLRIDADGDGQLSSAEIQFDIEAQAKRRQRERFRSADTDGDGVLSPGEFERLRGGHSMNSTFTVVAPARQFTLSVYNRL